MFEKTIEKVTEYFTGDRFMPEVKVAREDYFRRTGKVFEDENLFEIRMTAFLEWYLFDRLLWDYGIPPVRLYCEMFGESLSPEDVRVLRALERSVHALFVSMGQKGEALRIKNLFDDETYRVVERRTHVGIRKGDVFDGRVMQLGDQVLFSDALWIHSSDVKDFLLQEAQKMSAGTKENREALLFDLAYMKLKRERYQHVPASDIYNWEALKKERADLQRNSQMEGEG